MALRAEDYPSGSAIYSFVDHEGRNTHVDSEKLRQWCAAHKSELEVSLTPVNPAIAISFLTDNVIDMRHVKRVLEMQSLDPIIYGKVGTYHDGFPDVILIDGHHRFFCAFMCKVKLIPAYILEPAQWQEFQIIGLPDLTEAQLRASPTAKALK